MKLIFRTLALSIKMKSKLSRIVLLLSLPIAFLPILLSVKLQNITDGLVILGKEGTGLSYCLSILMQLSVLFLLQIVYRAIESYTREEDCILGAEYILEKTLECKAEIAYPYIENKDKFYERLERIDKFAKERIVESVATIMNLISVFITLVSIVILLGRINMYIVIMILITAFASSYLTYKQNNETFFWDIMWSEKSALANYFYGLCTEKEFIKDLRHYKLYPFFKKKWEQISEEHRVSKKKLMLKHFRNNSAADVIRSVVYLFVLAMTVQKIYQDPAIGIGVFMLVFSLTGQLQNAVTSLLSGTALFLKYIPYMEEYFYVQDLPREVNGKTDALVEQGDITFRNVSFTYPDCEQEVLHDISIEMKAGEKIAIVGENGSGKSTFISLLCGMLKPSAGKIVVGGCDIETETERIRNSISVVFQNFAHYADTLRNNINISDIKKECNDEEIHGLVKTIHMDEFIERYEEGLDTKLGSLSDHGNDLSGGQWQKIALLRAAYKTNSKIMILDEPTSALDPLAEAQLYEDFSKLTGDKTTLFISHRLGITALVDRVFVFENGRIAEVGTRSELMKKNGIFAAMYKAQAKWYVDNE